MGLLKHSDNSIVVYSKPYCTYCVKAKSFLEENGIPYNEVVLDVEQDDYMALRQELLDMTGGKHTTYPFIFVGTTFIGGYTDLVRHFETNSLHEMCSKIGIELNYSF